jgi:hypothetical protein
MAIAITRACTPSRAQRAGGGIVFAAAIGISSGLVDKALTNRL